MIRSFHTLRFAACLICCVFIRAHPFWYSGKWRYFSQTGDNSCYFPTHSTKLGVIPIEYWLFIVYCPSSQCDHAKEQPPPPIAQWGRRSIRYCLDTTVLDPNHFQALVRTSTRDVTGHISSNQCQIRTDLQTYATVRMKAEPHGTECGALQKSNPAYTA